MNLLQTLRATNPKTRWLLTAGLISLPLLTHNANSTAPVGAPAPSDPCRRSALQAFESCKNESLSDFWLARAKCFNIEDFDDRMACLQDAIDEFRDTRDECEDILDARLEVCSDIGGGYYEPEIDPANFVSVVDNPFFPLIPGTVRTFEKIGSGGSSERVQLTVLHATEMIQGVACTIVHDLETCDGEITEDTFDWFAQDVEGNVWYFGEISYGWEDGRVVDLDGSWKSGEDGAHAGILMPANPTVGEVNRQEYLLREAEDMGAVLALDANVQVLYGSFQNCLHTEDYTPLEPDALEHKFYAAGIGLILEVDLEDGERLELVSITHP